MFSNTCYPCRDTLKFYESEEWEAGLMKTYQLPVENTVKRYWLKLEVNIDVAALMTDPPANHILEVIQEITLSSPNLKDFFKTTFAHLWFMTNYQRSCVAHLPAFPAADTTDNDLSCWVLLDLSELQDMGLDVLDLDRLTLKIKWSSADGLSNTAGDVTINSGAIKIFPAEKLPGRRQYLYPFACIDYMDEEIETVTNKGIKLPAGLKILRLYVQLFDGKEPVKMNNTNLPEVHLSINNTTVWGEFTGVEAMDYWHIEQGFETYDWGVHMFGAVAGADYPFDLSYFVIDFIDPVVGQLSHALDAANEVLIRLVYDGAAGALTSPKIRIYYEYVFDALDRLTQCSGATVKSIPPEIRGKLINGLAVSKNPIAVIPDVASLSRAESRTISTTDLGGLRAIPRGSTSREMAKPVAGRITGGGSSVGGF